MTMGSVLTRFRAQLAESEPSDRSFGFLVAAGLLILGFRHRWLLVPAAALASLAALFPSTLRRPKRAWLFLGFLMSLVVNPLVLGLLFFFVITPVGLLMRAIGRDPLHLSPQRRGRASTRNNKLARALGVGDLFRRPAARSPTCWINRTDPASDMTEQF